MCETVGFLSGSLGCTAQCTFDTSQCSGPLCGSEHAYIGDNTCRAIFTSDIGDGSVEVRDSVDWNLLRSQTSGIITDTTNDIPIGINYYPNGQSYIRRVSLPFDTSSIPDIANVQSGRVTLVPAPFFPYGYVNTHPNSNDFLVLVDTNLVNPPSLSQEDFGNIGDLDAPQLFSEILDVSEEFGSFPRRDFDLVLNEDGLLNINSEGFTIFGLRTGYDLYPEIPNDGEPTTLAFPIRPSEFGFNQPKLEVIYTSFFVPPTCQCGDLNEDGMIDLNDFSIFANCFTLTGATSECSSEEFYCSDMDGSGQVDLEDFGTFANLYGLAPPEQYPPNCGQQIPECSDNLDNDNDGFVDYSRPIPAGCEWAEHDGDGSFDEDDIEDFYLCFNNTAQAPPECLWADIAPKPNGDGIVDLDDFAELALCTNPLPDGFSPIPDRACSSAGDDDEDTTVFECGDGIDNDGDGLIDMDDQPNCVTVQDNTEDYPFPACDGFEFGGYCWFEGAQGESCDTVCQNIGKTCIQEDWNDDTSCTVCKHFHAGAGCAVQTGVYMPSYSPNMCRYRDDISNQICNMAPPAYQRQCACA